jgi:hypothetical protein
VYRRIILKWLTEFVKVQTGLDFCFLWPWWWTYGFHGCIWVGMSCSRKTVYLVSEHLEFINSCFGEKHGLLGIRKYKFYIEEAHCHWICYLSFQDSCCVADHLMKFQSRYTRISLWRNASCQLAATTSGHLLALLLHLHHHHENRDTYFSRHRTNTLQTEHHAAMWPFCIAWHKVLLCYCVPRVMVQCERWPSEIGVSSQLHNCGRYLLLYGLTVSVLGTTVKWWTVIRKNILLHKAM